MATTVNYKGAVLTTVDNQTRTLKTAGKYMEGDLTLVDITGGTTAITVEDELDPSGGIIRTITAVDISNDTVRADVLLQGYTAHDRQGNALVGTASGGSASGTIQITTNGTYNVAQYEYADVQVPTGGTINNQDKTVTPTTSQQTVTADSGYTGLGTVTVNAMPTGSAGNPTATKGTVSNHSVSVTPSVTNTTGYITGGTKTGTAVTVSASELVSGGETKTANGTYDVTNLASLVVAVPFVTYYTGSSAPSSSLGSNGDIYLQTSS